MPAKVNTVNSQKPSVRERLLAAADELFYSEGIQTVGIDRVVQKAGVAKASLYNVFGSKDELVQAYLDARTDRTRQGVERTLTRFRTPRERLLGVFDAQGQIFTEPDFNGCAHITASAEAVPGGPVECATDRYRKWVRTLFTDLAREAGVTDYEELARQLHLLYDGAGVSARMDRDPSAATTARAAAAALFDAAVKNHSEAGTK
ncbi:TetR/AcrR family transcriptional regulator [Catenulispora rubra]|uniref:TetR/AcrR family transcriptional regulator n=1 Tax=Catenulispora rubra TaxID=280293 RepID=UPI001891FA41|nr:TetR/AcrR family transcriptional regulator [Catenulispora rubra]